MDEILNKLDPNESEYHQFLQRRSIYGRRLEVLRNHEVRRKDMGTTLLLGNPSTPAGTSGNKVRRMSRVAFDENMDPRHTSNSSIPTPTSFMRKPYHTLRTVRRTIETGAFLSPQGSSPLSDLFIPRVVWKQFNVKLSGLPSKLSAFDSLIRLIEGHIECLVYPDSFDCDSVLLVINSFQAFAGELADLQNSLSKPFPYINEVSTSASGAAAAGDGGKEQGGWSSLMAGFGKTVVKYAEVSYQRFGAMQTHVSDEDFFSYSQLLLVLCEKCQVCLRLKSRRPGRVYMMSITVCVIVVGQMARLRGERTGARGQGCQHHRIQGARPEEILQRGQRPGLPVPLGLRGLLRVVLLLRPGGAGLLLRGDRHVPGARLLVPVPGGE